MLSTWNQKSHGWDGMETGCLIGIFIMVHYNPYILGSIIPHNKSPYIFLLNPGCLIGRDLYNGSL